MKYVRLRLDDALSQIQHHHETNTGTRKPFDPSSIDPKELEEICKDWSEARKKAFRQITSNPNSYYYRFNAPGEKQRNGAWSAKEKEKFFERLREMGADGQWGIFSMAIEGRVGYQCSNFYRGLIKSGKMQDANYIKDEKGELRYLFGKKDGGAGVIRTHMKPHILGGSSSSALSSSTIPTQAARRKTRKRKQFNPDADENGSDEDDSGTFYCSTGNHDEEVSSEILLELDNPLPNFTDPITLEPVVKPAISPYGHVMGYDTWVMCLSGGGNKCPITKQDLKKRELVILTTDNIDEYRNKIVND
ncbi:hypothetical protein HK096_010526 [Nowakowskiella sp. JEL0078]|nr:hypothetical protein HK096_010526 [Nowakowskiella sp. JEL0078]